MNPASTQAFSSRSDRSTLTWIAIAFVLLSLIAKYLGGAVMVLVLGLPYLLACGIHLWVHRRAAARLRIDSIDVAIIFSSHVPLLCGFLLQEDSDTEGPLFVTVSALVHGDIHHGVVSWFWFNAWAPFVGLPVAVSWLVLFLLPMPLARRAAVRVAGLFVVGALAVLPVVAVVAVVLTN